MMKTQNRVDSGNSDWEQTMGHTTWKATDRADRQWQLLVVIAGVGAAMLILLNLGFWVADDVAPEELRQAALVAIMVEVVLGIVSFKRNWIDKRGLRLALATRVPLVAPKPYRAAAVGTADDGVCKHIEPIAQAMRLSGISVRQCRDHLEADCRIDLQGLRHQLGSAAVVMYTESDDIDLSVLSQKTALFWCAQCQSRLYVINPEQVLVQTTNFPNGELDKHDVQSAIGKIKGRIIEGLLGGKSFSTAHKEGGTRVYFKGMEFRRLDYGEWTSEQVYTDDATVLASLWRLFEWEAKRDLQTVHPSEAQVWTYILGRMQK